MNLEKLRKHFATILGRGRDFQVWNLQTFYQLQSFSPSPCLLPAFLQLTLQLHFLANLLPMIGAGQPSGLDYWSLPTAAYPRRERSKHNETSCSLFKVPKTVSEKLRAKNGLCLAPYFLSKIAQNLLISHLTRTCLLLWIVIIGKLYRSISKMSW